MPRLLTSLCWMVLLSSCHDAPRNNPFDPALTPAVQLTVALDDTAGTATLTWTPYEGQQPFREYRILRNIADRKSVDTLAHISAVERIAFVDTTLAPNTAYVYRVEVVNVGGYANASEEKGVTGFSVGAVQLGEVEPNPQSGELVLRWSRYVGPDFQAYQVRRRAVGTDQEEVLAKLSGVTDTSLVDSSALAGVDYLYSLVVQAAGQQLSSNAQEGRLVLPPVEITQAEFNSAEASVSLIWTPYAGPRFNAYRVERRSAGLALQVLKEIPDLADTSFADRGLVGNTQYFYRVVVVTERGEEVESEEKSGIFHELLATWPLSVAERPFVRLYSEGDRIEAIVTTNSAITITLITVALLTFDEEGQTLTKQNIPYIPGLGLSTATVKIGEERRLFAVVKTGYDESGQKSREAVFAILEQVPGGAFLQQEHVLSIEALPQLRGEEWQNFRQEKKVRNFGFGGSLPHRQTIEKTDSVYRLLLSLDLFKQDAELDWYFTPPDTLHLEPQEQHITEPLHMVETLFYQLRLEAVQGEVRASVLSPAIASGVIQSGIPWTSLALIGDTPVLTVYDQPYILTPEDELVPLSPFEAGVSEMRVWEGRRRGSTQVGVCLPRAGQLLLGAVLEGQEADWPSSLTSSLGPTTGRPADLLSYPLSFDVGPDGRIYVLDAGNARIVVFDSSRRYVTQWGSWGNAEGEFDFGRGGRSPSGELDFAGSIAVDDQGFIYVCDEINRRIQKFAP